MAGNEHAPFLSGSKRNARKLFAIMSQKPDKPV
jgi:hypothetical protein